MLTAMLTAWVATFPTLGAIAACVHGAEAARERLAEHQPPALWITAPVTAPGLAYRQFASAAARTSVSYHIYVPPHYGAEPDRRFPVLYWLHGSGGGLRGIAPVSARFDAAIRAGQIPPTLVVFANGMAASMWADSKNGRVPMETVVARDLVDEIDLQFRTIATREGRLLEGFSMGGQGASRIGLRHAERFAAFSALAGGPIDLDFRGPRTIANPAERATIFREVYGEDLTYYAEQSPLTVAGVFAASAAPRPRIRIVVGDADETIGSSRALHERLTALRIAHEYIVVPGVGHDTMGLFTALGNRAWSFYGGSR
jgi:enterochelin esterase-like enzyme